MFSTCLVAAAIATFQANDPVARLTRYMEGTTHYRATFVVSDAKMNKVADCTWELVRPRTQKLEAKGKAFNFSFVQDENATVFFSNHEKVYLEWPEFESLAPPPPQAGILTEIYPNFLASPKSLRRFKWSTSKPASVNGTSVDEVDASESSSSGNLTVHLFVDKEGRASRFYLKVDSPMGKSEFTWDFTAHERLATIDNVITTHIPDGYVPHSVMPPHRPVTASEPAPEVSVVDMATGKDTTLAVKGKPRVFVFTAPDCEVSQAMAKALAKAEAAAGDKASFMEVSLGPVKPSTSGRDSKRPLYWDKSGKAEREWGINYTPYILIVNKDGAIDRGFGGYGQDQEEVFLKTIAAGVKSAGE